MLPNFFLLGPPKTGTTALAEALGRHPQVFMSTPKEPNYFLYAGGNPYKLRMDRGVPDFEDYVRLFDGAGAARIRGEASPYYITAPHCAREIKRQVPDAKLMVILRNPVERAFSAYRYWYKDSPQFRCDPADFREKFLNRTIVTDSSRGEAGVPAMEWLQDMGRYAEMIERFDEHFSSDQLMLLSYDEMAADPGACMARVVEFLDVDPQATPEIRQANVTFEPSWRQLNHWLNFDQQSGARRLLVASLRDSRLAGAVRERINSANRRPVPTRNRPLPASIYNELIQVYADDLRRLARRANLDVSDWLRPRVEEDRPAWARRATALAASPPAPSTSARPAPSRGRLAAARRWWSHDAGPLAVRSAAPVALVASALAYWLWPTDLIPDASAFGRVDDLACLIALCFVAGRLSVRKAA